MKRFLPYIGPVIGLTGVSLALYFHAQSVQERAPTFYVGQPRAVIVDARGPTPTDLQVLYKGKAVASSVTAVTIYLWNAGKLPIRSADVLGDPVSIELGSGAEILEARLLKLSRPVIQLSAGQITDRARNSLPITFDILERDDGAAIQLIYSGNPNTAVQVKGTIVGAGAPKYIAIDDSQFTSSSPKELQRNTKRGGYVLAAGAVFLVFFGVWSWRDGLTEDEDLRRSSLRYGIATIIIGLVALSFSVYELYTVHKAQAPVPQTIWTAS